MTKRSFNVKCYYNANYGGFELMPVPKPKSGESEDDFLSRCLGDPNMESEFPDNDQRLAVCGESWRAEMDKDKIKKMLITKWRG